MSVIKSVTVNAYSNVAAVCPVAPPVRRRLSIS